MNAYEKISANSEEPYKSMLSFQTNKHLLSIFKFCEHSYVKTVEIVYFQAMYNIHNPKKTGLSHNCEYTGC